MSYREVQEAVARLREARIWDKMAARSSDLETIVEGLRS